MDLLPIEGVVGALGYSPPGDLLTGEGDQGLAAALPTEVIQDENGVWLKLVSLEKAEDVLDSSIVGQTLHPDQGTMLG